MPVFLDIVHSTLYPLEVKKVLNVVSSLSVHVLKLETREVASREWSISVYFLDNTSNSIIFAIPQLLDTCSTQSLLLPIIIGREPYCRTFLMLSSWATSFAP